MTGLLLAVLLAHAAAAQPADNELHVKSETMAGAVKAFQEEGDAKLSASMTAAQCVKDAKCWGFVKTIFARQFGLACVKVDGALPGQFFPNTTTFTLRAAVKGTGHYLYVLCGTDLKKGRPCERERDELEKRVFESAVVLSLPATSRPEDLVDLETLKLSEAGKALLNEAKGARPSLVTELLGDAITAMGVEDNPVPRALRR